MLVSGWLMFWPFSSGQASSEGFHPHSLAGISISVKAGPIMMAGSTYSHGAVLGVDQALQLLTRAAWPGATPEAAFGTISATLLVR